MSRLFDPGASERNDRVDERLHGLAKELLGTIFESTWEGRSDVTKTPKRFVEMLWELSTPEEFEFTTFESDNDEMVIVQDIPLSLFALTIYVLLWALPTLDMSQQIKQPGYLS